ncbi:MAG TPA: hypothetical protein VL860_11175 [Planctomycetota bacterium]|nr:hypothetical protein [Planctomycetota bacterium]
MYTTIGGRRKMLTAALAATLLAAGLFTTGGCTGSPRDAVFRATALDHPWDTVASNFDDQLISDRYFKLHALSHPDLFAER